jgi:voltage-gated potassium channel
MRAGILLAITFTIGTIGFWILGSPEHGLVDAIYMTTITVTTVGYTETIPISNSTGAKIFTTLLLFGGVGSFLTLFSNLTAFMIDGGLETLLRTRRAKRRLESITGHYVVAGCGETGVHVVDELLRAGHEVVAIDPDPARFRGMPRGVVTVLGDAGSDEILKRARIHTAAGLSACVGSDRDNLIVVVSARRLASGVRIAARSSEVRTESKLRAAGADSVISPNAIAAHRIVSSVTRPQSLAFLQRLGHADPSESVLFDASVHGASPLAGRTLGELRDTVEGRLVVLAAHSLDGDGWTFAPSDDEVLFPGRAIVLIGSRDLAQRLSKLGLD